MRVADGEQWGARRASIALALAVIAVAAMPLLARFASTLAQFAAPMAARF